MVFPTFFNLSLNLAIRSWWLEPQSVPSLVFAECRASQSLAAKNIINLTLVLTIWWCLCVESSLLLLEEGAMTSVFSWQNSISFCPASFHIPKPNLPVTPGNSCDHRTLFSPQESPYRKICVNNGWSPCGFHVNEVKSCNPVMKWLGWSRYKKIWNICRVLFRLD